MVLSRSGIKNFWYRDWCIFIPLSSSLLGTLTSCGTLKKKKVALYDYEPVSRIFLVGQEHHFHT